MAEQLYIATRTGLAVAEKDGSWQMTAKKIEGEYVTSLCANQTVALAGTQKGIQRSEDGGATWTSSNEGLDHLHVRWLTIHNEADGLVFAGTEPAGIFVSTDNGKTWNGNPEVARLRDEYNWMLPYSPEAGCVRGFGIHGDRIYVAVEVGGLLVSEDKGTTWNLAKGSEGKPSFASTPPGIVHADVHSIEVHPSDPDLIFAPTGGGLYRSTDGGANWDFLYNCYCRAAWIDPADPNHIIFGPADGVGRNGRIEETDDGGKSWKDISTKLETPWPKTMPERFYQLDDELFCILDNGQLLVSKFGVFDWEFITDINDVTAVYKKF